MPGVRGPIRRSDGEKARLPLRRGATSLLETSLPKEAIKKYPKPGEIRKFVLEQLKGLGPEDIG